MVVLVFDVCGLLFLFLKDIYLFSFTFFACCVLIGVAWLLCVTCWLFVVGRWLLFVVCCPLTLYILVVLALFVGCVLPLFLV